MTDLPRTFSALSDPTRFAIVERLLHQGEQPAGTLAEGAAISAPAISRHLKVLRQAGVIEQRVDGPRRIYAVNPQAMQAISAWTISHRAFWQASLARLDSLIQQKEAEK